MKIVTSIVILCLFNLIFAETTEQRPAVEEKTVKRELVVAEEIQRGLNFLEKLDNDVSDDFSLQAVEEKTVTRELVGAADVVSSTLNAFGKAYQPNNSYTQKAEFTYSGMACTPKPAVTCLEACKFNPSKSCKIVGCTPKSAVTCPKKST